MNEKAKFVQMSCDFYDQHSESDKQWFARNYEQCDEPYEKNNLCMHKWQFPLFVLRSQQAEIEKLKEQLKSIESIMNDYYTGSFDESSEMVGLISEALVGERNNG